MTGKQDADLARCALCGGTLAMGHATIPFVRDEHVVTIRGVPAEVCGDCGEAYMTGSVVDDVQKLVAELEALHTDVSVARYRAA